MRITKFFCDVCGKELSSEDVCYTITFSAGTGFSLKKEVCNECTLKAEELFKNWENGLENNPTEPIDPEIPVEPETPEDNTQESNDSNNSDM